MGLVGAAFVGGTAALAFLLGAEVVAATAAVSEAALVYVARHRNLMISTLMIAVQAALTVGILSAIGMRSTARRGRGRSTRRPAPRGAGAGARPRLDPQGAACSSGCSARRSRAGAGR